jgi:hypothetical protein
VKTNSLDSLLKSFLSRYYGIFRAFDQILIQVTSRSLVFAQFLIIFVKMNIMKAAGILLVFFFSSWIGMSQEIPAVREESRDFIIERLEIRPSLTILAPEVPNTGRFRIREVNFDTSLDRREVDIAALMAQESQMKRRTVELAPPVQIPQAPTSNLNNRNNDFQMGTRFFNQSFSPELQTRGTRNSVYRNAAETTGATYLNSFHNPFLRSRGYSPYSRGYYY